MASQGQDLKAISCIGRSGRPGYVAYRDLEQFLDGVADPAMVDQQLSPWRRVGIGCMAAALAGQWRPAVHALVIEDRLSAGCKLLGQFAFAHGAWSSAEAALVRGWRAARG